MRRPGRALVCYAQIKFASTNITNSEWTQLTLLGPNGSALSNNWLPSDVDKMKLMNSAADDILIGSGPSGSPYVVDIAGLSAPVDESPTILNKGAAIYVQSTSVATLSAGILTIAFYN